MDTLAAVIAGHPFMQSLQPRLIQVLAESAMERDFAGGEAIFREGDLANRFYLILSGRVALESQNSDLRNVLIQTVGAGDVLGWSWLFPPYYWNFDARALEPTAAIFFYGTRLREQCEVDADLGYQLMKRFTQVPLQSLQHTGEQVVARRHSRPAEATTPESPKAGGRP